MAEIQHQAKDVIQDESKLIDRLLSYTGNERHSKKAAQEKALRDTKSRIAFIEEASKRLFEEKITGNVPESMFKKMFADYERELSDLEDKAADMRRDLAESESNEADVQKWLALVKDCASIISLDRATAYKLIDHVDVHEQTDEYGHIIQSVRIKYNFVGCIS